MLGYHRFRRLFFWTFVVAFVLTSSLVLFYAFGYRYSVERGIFVYSGSITLKTTPESVTVSVDGETLPEQSLSLLNNSIHLTGLMPGEHAVSVSAPGYRSWEKRALVSSGISTEFWNVVLLRESFVPTTLPDTARVIHVDAEPGADRLALVQSVEVGTSVVLFDRSTTTRREIFASPTLRWSDQEKDDIEWSPDGRFVALPLVDGNGMPRPVIVDAGSGESIVLSDIVPSDRLDCLRFDPNERGVLFFLASDTLYRLPLAGSRLSEPLLSGVKTYDLSGNSVFAVLYPAQTIVRFRSNGSPTSMDVIAENAPELGTVSLAVYDEDRLALLEDDAGRRLFVFNRGETTDAGFRELGSGVESQQFSDDGKKLLYATHNEMNVYFFRPWEVQPTRTENSIVQIGRFSQNVEHVQWTEDYEHVLFGQGPTIKMAELDHRDRRVIGDLLGLPGQPTQVLPIFEDNLLWFLVPGQDLISLAFPEPQGLFGQ